MSGITAAEKRLIAARPDLVAAMRESAVTGKAPEGTGPRPKL